MTSPHSTERVAPFHCPYCGDLDLRPAVPVDGESHGAAWECHSCLRAFTLRFTGHLARPAGVTR